MLITLLSLFQQQPGASLGLGVAGFLFPLIVLLCVIALLVFALKK